MGDDGIRIREVGSTDIEHLLDLRMEVLAAVFADDSWDAGQLRAENRIYYESHLGMDHVACIATIEGIEAGCGAICLQSEMPSPDNPSGKCAYLMNVYTRPAFRHRGVGKAAVTWLIGQAHERGAGKICLEATEAGHPFTSIWVFGPWMQW